MIIALSTMFLGVVMCLFTLFEEDPSATWIAIGSVMFLLGELAAGLCWSNTLERIKELEDKVYPSRQKGEDE